MKTKKEYKYFSIFSYEKEQDYLREMHQHGWRFVKVTGFGVYHFEECEPADVIYQLDYNQEGLSHKTEYVQMFNDCGWEYIQDYAGYCYFRKPASEILDLQFLTRSGLQHHFNIRCCNAHLRHNCQSSNSY